MVVVFDRKKEITYCFVCKQNYDHNACRPECLIPCGHTFCHECIKKLFSKNCSRCGSLFNQIIPDYEMVDMISTSSDLKDKKNIPHATPLPNSLTLPSVNQEFENKKNEDLNDHQNQLKPEFIHLIMEGTREQQLIGVNEVRKLLSKENHPPIDEIIKSGLVPKLIELLDSNDTKIQFECVWALTNIASGNSMQTLTIIKAGGVPKFIDLLNSTSEEVQEQSVWALGNIAGDGAHTRDLVLNHGILQPILKFLNDKTKPLSFIKNTAWCLSNLFRFKPMVEFEKIKDAMPVLDRYLVECSDSEVLTDILWGLSYLSDGSTAQIQLFLDNITIKNVTDKIGHQSLTVVTPVLRIIGNIASGSDEQTQIILDLDVLKDFQKCLGITKSKSHLKEICWTISNITAGTSEQIQQVIDSGIMPRIIELIRIGEYKIKKEALWVISNAFSGGTKDQMLYLVNLGALEAIDKQLATIEDTSMQSLCLSVFESVGQNLENVLKVTIEDLQLPKTLSVLKNSTNSEVVQKATKIAENFISTRSSGSYEGDEPSDNDFDDNQDIIS
ncbi:importin subunit alpha-like [Brachionus plicatilis]|uniref:Importin subunit alpha-like n=1 Tax=Brachionus plicatilis TaxID=10195 RepID=A0A3M7S3G8_BRAPC|nr:importin subunit alpha-like [Brachionus plicatilis]